jgi:ribA/ribD-fused uncharacterized protein
MSATAPEFEETAKVRRQGVVLFWRVDQKNAYLCNWYRSPLKVVVGVGEDSQSIEFSTVEQYIMHAKAELFGDSTSADKILRCHDPSKVKKLGRRVRNFKESTWSRQRRPILLRALRAKFSQNPELARRLVATGEKPIAEASPSDTIFGIGWAPDAPQAQDPDLWKGQNILGEALMTVRGELCSGELLSVTDVPTGGGDANDYVGGATAEVTEDESVDGILLVDGSSVRVLISEVTKQHVAKGGFVPNNSFETLMKVARQKLNLKKKPTRAYVVRNSSAPQRDGSEYPLELLDDGSFRLFDGDSLVVTYGQVLG